MSKWNIKVILVSLIFIILIGCKANNYSHIEIRPDSNEGKDAFVEYYPLSDYANRNFGDLDEFAAVAWTASGIEFIVRSFIEFDLNNIPSGTIIIKARLLLYAGDSPGHGSGHSTLSGSNMCILNRVITPWEESTITWNNQPATTDQDAVIMPESEDQMQDYFIDVTEMVQYMVDNPDSNYGFMLNLQTEDYYRRMVFASSDCKDALKRPTLIVYLDE